VSFRRNLGANYASQIYSTLLGIVIVPVYLGYLGVEAYGLIGVFSMLQAWFGLLDVGLTPTISRESARLRAGAVDPLDYRRLIRALTLVFVTIAILGCSVLLCFSDYFAIHWLHAESIPIVEVRRAIELMIVAVGARWLSGLARGRVTGAEEIVWISGFNAAIATMRYVGVLPVLRFVGTTPTIFFVYQLATAALELVVLTMKAQSLLPTVDASKRIGWSIAPIRSVLAFSLTVAFTSSVWVFATQTDKLVLSKMLSLRDYGYFSLAVVIAGSVLIATGPISTVLIPRLTRLDAQSDRRAVADVYGLATSIVSVIAMPVAFTLAAFSVAVVWAWTGDATAAREVAPIVALYAIGNAVLAVSAFPAYIQFARGNLRLHLIGSITFVVVLVPALLLGVSNGGAVGAGWAWVATNVLYLVAWVPFVHGRLMPGLHRDWFSRGVLPPLLISGVSAWIAHRWVPIPLTTRWEAGAVPVAIGAVTLVLSALPLARRFVVERRRLAQS
jgi:O-antigen/teichoic acid export membrane protein